MKEQEPLIQRSKMLQENVSKINYEVEKIDRRLASLEEIADSEHFDRHRPHYGVPILKLITLILYVNFLRIRKGIYIIKQ